MSGIHPFWYVGIAVVVFFASRHRGPPKKILHGQALYDSITPGVVERHVRTGVRKKP